MWYGPDLAQSTDPFTEAHYWSFSLKPLRFDWEVRTKPKPLSLSVISLHDRRKITIGFWNLKFFSEKKWLWEDCKLCVHCIGLLGFENLRICKYKVHFFMLHLDTGKMKENANQRKIMFFGYPFDPLAKFCLVLHISLLHYRKLDWSFVFLFISYIFLASKQMGLCFSWNFELGFLLGGGNSVLNMGIVCMFRLGSSRSYSTAISNGNWFSLTHLLSSFLTYVLHLVGFQSKCLYFNKFM